MSLAVKTFADELAALSVKQIARRANTNERTAENWKEGKNGPGWRQVCAMLNDSVMRPIVLRAASRADESRLDEIRRLGT